MLSENKQFLSPHLLIKPVSSNRLLAVLLKKKESLTRVEN